MNFETRTDSTSSQQTDKQIFLQYATLDILMLAIGSVLGFHVFVRYDPLRKKNCFTVVIGDKRIADTDSPLKILRDWIDRNMTEEQIASIFRIYMQYVAS